jgi:Mg2+ and Co2+ transporter CorA
MDIFLIGDNQVTHSTTLPEAVPARGFLWLDATHDEVAADPELWRDRIAQATGVHIYDPHLTDAVNLAHPSYFDSTNAYAMVVFRKLALNTGPAPETAPEAPPDNGMRRKIPPALTRLATLPVTFLLMDHALVTVHAPNSRTVESVRARLLEYRERADGNSHGARRPSSPEDLMLRLLNAMVDQYLELRQPLTAQLDRWQRALLDPRRPFKDWSALLDARIELRKLDHLCEEQHDALQELRDYVVDSVGEVEISRGKDLLLVRINDVMEHVTRVLNHARRLESSIESAVQIHFSAMAHRTSEIMRTLTVITALFMPLTLITGIFGMNFSEMPLLKNHAGFWLTMGAMALIVVAMLAFFRRRRYLDERVLDHHRREHK